VAVVLVLISAFLHAAWNALLKREPNKDRVLIAAVTFGALFATVVAVARARSSGTAPFPNATAVGWALVAGALEHFYFRGIARALDAGPLAPVYTISRGGAVLVVYPLSVLLFGELVTVASVIASAMIVLGLVLSGVRSKTSSDTRPMTSTAMSWATTCAVAIAGYHLAYKASLSAGGASSAVFAVSMTFASTLNWVRTGAAGRRAILAFVRIAPVRVVAMGLLCGGSFLMLIEALASGGAGYALTLRNTSVLFAVGLAWAIGEPPKLWVVVGAALVAVGAIAMTL